MEGGRDLSLITGREGAELNFRKEGGVLIH